MENKDLLRECLALEERLGSWDTEVLLQIGEAIGISPKGCLSLFDFYQQGGEKIALESEKGSIYVNRESDTFSVSAGGKDVLLSREAFFVFLGVVSDCFLPVYPLGSLVRLKRKYFPVTEDISEDMPVEIVITDRFMINSKHSVYYPYGGVIYPIGMPDLSQRIKFGSQLVEKVIFLGHTDEREEAYVSIMKEEILVNMNMHSMSFAGKEESEVLTDIPRRESGDKNKS